MGKENGKKKGGGQRKSEENRMKKKIERREGKREKGILEEGKVKL